MFLILTWPKGKCFPKNSLTADVTWNKCLHAMSSNAPFCTHSVDYLNYLGDNYWKLSFGEVNQWFYGWKIHFTMCISRAVLYDPKIAWRFTSPNDNFKCSYPHSNAFIQLFCWKKNVLLFKAPSAVACVKSNASQWKAMLCDVRFLTVYRRIYEGMSINNQPIPFPMDWDGHDFHALFQYMIYTWVQNCTCIKSFFNKILNVKPG